MPSLRYGQNRSQEAYFAGFGNLIPDMARMGLRRPILRVLGGTSRENCIQLSDGVESCIHDLFLIQRRRDDYTRVHF